MGYSEGAGGDYIQIDWSVGGSVRAVIPASVIFAENPNGLATRQLNASTLNGVTTYTDFTGAVVVPTKEQPIVDCGVNYSMEQSFKNIPSYASVAAANADTALVAGNLYTVLIAGGAQLYIK
jgi:hypothetical protein